MCNVILLFFFSDVCQTTVNMEADAARPGMVSHAPVMGQDTPEPPVTHVRMCVWVYFFFLDGCVCIHACGLLLPGYVF